MHRIFIVVLVLLTFLSESAFTNKTSEFGTLQPAMTIMITLGERYDVGSFSRGTPLTVVAEVNGTIKSEPGFSPVIDAQWVGVGNDYIHGDPDGKHIRIDSHAVVKDKSGALIYFGYSGPVPVTPEIGLVLSGSPEGKTTDFGVAFVGFNFETGAEAFKELETAHYVGTGRFVVEKDSPVLVEYKVSKAVKGK